MTTTTSAINPPTLLKLRLGTRGSMLARTQSQWVANALEKAHGNLRVELVIIQTSGDKFTDRPLYEAGGKGLFTKELEQALLRHEVDFAVHSFKDVPVTMPLVDTADLVIGASPFREDPRDVLVCGSASAPRLAATVADLPPGAVVGTGSLRRKCQLLHLRPDLVIQPLRGNIDTRLRKAAGGEYDAVVLAMAGLKRGGLFDESFMTPLDAATFIPAAGQGALALESRRGDAATMDVLRLLHDPRTMACVELERALVSRLGGDCHSPIAAHATISGSAFTLRAALGQRDGNPPVVYGQAQGPLGDGPGIVAQVYQRLLGP